MQATSAQANGQEAQPPLLDYLKADGKIPGPCGWPINPEMVNPFVDTGTIVTFSALVPLEKLIYGDIDELNDYCMEAFAGSNCVDIANTEFRVVGGEDECDSWNDRFQGDVHLQVTCTLQGE